MSKNESVKASLDFYKGLIYLTLTALFTVCGYFANSYKTAEIIDLIALKILDFHRRNPNHL